MAEPAGKKNVKLVAPMFYLLDSRTVVGNCALWWRPDGAGYTTNLDEAGLYTYEAACGQRDSDVPVPAHVARRLSVTHVRLDTLGDSLKKMEALRKKEKAARKKAEKKVLEDQAEVMVVEVDVEVDGTCSKKETLGCCE
jgi:hypothetical protein